jgi:hypothetical protein
VIRVAVQFFEAKLTANSAFALADTMIVKVGLEEKKYILYKELLVHNSGFFRGALSGNFKETDDGVVPLTDVEPKVFAFVINWMYTGVLPDRVHVHAPNDGNDVSFRYHAYVLADRLLIPGLRKAISEVAFGPFLIQPPKFVLLIFAFNNLTDEDPLICLLLDAYCVQGGLRIIGTDKKVLIDKLPREFLIRMMAKFHEMVGMKEQEKRMKRGDYNI